MIEHEAVGPALAHALDELVHLARPRAGGQRVQVGQQPLALLGHEPLELRVSQRLVPERRHVAPLDLRRLEHLAEEPHRAPVDVHDLLRREGVGLV